MKYLFSFLFLFSWLFSPGQNSNDTAKTVPSGKLWYGVKVGGNIPVRKKLPGDSLTGIVKPGAGLFVAYQATPWLRPQFEIEYSSLTFKKTTDERVTNNYLDLGLNIYVKPGNKTNVTLNLGVQTSITQGTVYRKLNGQSLGGLTSRYSNVYAGRVDYLFCTGFTFPASNKVDFFGKYHFTLTAEETPNVVIGKTSYIQFGISVNLNKFIEENETPSPEQLKREKDNQALMDGGVLLVRLNYPTNMINRLEEGGDHAGAETLRKNYDAFNMQLIQAFRTYYHFTPVYFFRDSKSDKILANDFDSLFVNDSLQDDPSIVCYSRKFLIAEIGYVELISGNIVDNMLVVLNPQFRQMKTPFPYSTTNLRLFEGAKRYLVGIDPEKMSVADKNVYLLNQRLIKFYQDYYGYIKK